MGISRFQPCTEEKNLGTKRKKRVSSKSGVFCSVHTLALRYKITFYENYANVLILLDAINNGKRGRKLNPSPFVHISHFSIFPLKSLHLFIFHLFIFQSARSYITFIRWRMIRYNDFARTCKGDEIVRSLPVVGNGSSEKKICWRGETLIDDNQFRSKNCNSYRDRAARINFWKGSAISAPLSATRIAQISKFE